MGSQSESGGRTRQEPRAPWIEASATNTRLRSVTVLDRAAISRLVLDPEQEQFAGSVDTIFAELEASRFPELEHPFAIVANRKRVGFFILREKQAAPVWAPCGVVTLHSFRIRRVCQGKGFGRAGVQLAISWVRQSRPDVERLMLAVNARNVIAKAVYLNCGFVDTGTTFPGPIGEQHILALDIPRHGV